MTGVWTVEITGIYLKNLKPCLLDSGGGLDFTSYFFPWTLHIMLNLVDLALQHHTVEGILTIFNENFYPFGDMFLSCMGIPKC